MDGAQNIAPIIQKDGAQEKMSVWGRGNHVHGPSLPELKRWGWGEKGKIIFTGKVQSMGKWERDGMKEE